LLLANCRRTASYVVFHCTLHFCVTLKPEFSCSDRVGGVTKITPPTIPLARLSPGVGMVRALFRHRS
jgi:hypothetical protein